MDIRNTDLIVFLTTTFGFSAGYLVERDLTALAQGPQVSLIVRNARLPEARHPAKLTAGWAACALDAVDRAACMLPASALADLESEPGVAYVSPDRCAAATFDFVSPAVS